MKLLTLIRTLGFALCLASPALAQTATRTQQWDAYALPNDAYTRYVDAPHGLTLWHPTAWQTDGKGNFSKGDEASLSVIFESLPEGLGVASYATATLRQFRRSLNIENATVRPVFLCGLEGREIALESVQNGQRMRQTLWMMQHGPLGYTFLFVAKAGAAAQLEPHFKRIMLSARLGATGHWDADFEKLRAAYPNGTAPERDARASLLAESLHTGAIKTEQARAQLTALWQEAPDAALDLLTDANPNVRAAAIVTLPEPRADDLLFWALRDPDPYAAAQAARLLATRGHDQLKPRVASLAAHPAALLRLAAVVPDAAARAWAEDLLATDNADNHIAALRLALALPLTGLPLPYEKLLRSTRKEVIYGTLEALRVRREPAQAELLRLATGDTERWAVRALGDLGDPSLLARFESRIKEIDTRLGGLLKTGLPAAGITFTVPRPPRRPVPSGRVTPPPAPPPPALKPVASPELAPVDSKNMPETLRLSLLRGDLVLATDKLKLRGRWTPADAATRRLIEAETLQKVELAAWSRWAFAPAPSAEPALSVDANRLANLPTDGSTLFPADATLYGQAPNLAQTLARFNGALGGIQMEGVRDQMAFTFFLQNIRKISANAFDAPRTADASAALGADLHAPLAVAAWPAHNDPTARSGVTLRVTDHARFERILAAYQQSSGGAHDLVLGASVLARFAGIFPSAITLGLTSLPGIRARRANGTFIAAHAFQRQETIGGLPVTVFERLAFYTQDQTARETLYVAYLGDTALLAPSRAALGDMLATALGQRAALVTTNDYQRARNEKGEIVYFSRLDALFGQLPSAGVTAPTTFAGTESGALQVASGLLESSSRVQLNDARWLSRLQDFRPADLTLPRQAWPRSTLFYAGANLDPATAWDTMKETGLFNGGLLDASFASVVAPKLQGEVGLALLEPRFMYLALAGYTENIPTPFVYGFRLKDAELGRLAQLKRAFGKDVYPNNRTLLGRPVYLVQGVPAWYYLVVTDQYLFISQDFETLAKLQQPDKIAAAPDWARITATESGPLRFFATFNSEAALEIVRATLPKNDVGTEYTLQFLSAWTHAFHSQRLTLKAEEGALAGRLAVSFDRAGRLSADDLARNVEAGDVAFAAIIPRGPDLQRQTKLETLKLRVTAKQPGIVPRLRDDIAAFDWQKVAAGDDKSFTFTINERRIPEQLTVRLPVAGAQFAPYLQATRSINANAPEVVKLAREIAGTDRDGRSVARKIGAWTYSNLKWKKVESASVETLASREADCYEHSELYVALARSLGLPARVVTGAAYSEGSFGAHAWVEVYLGRWVELDPTWGLLDRVDATHLRFDRETFVYYAMLNQLELEILEARNHVTEVQRDPLKLLAAMDEDEDTSPGADAFDFDLTLARVFTEAERAKFTDAQKQALRRAFDREVENQYDPLDGFGAHVLKSEINGPTARILALQDTQLVTLTMAARDGVWHIVECEISDNAAPAFAPVLREVLAPDTNPLRVWEFDDTEKSLAYLDGLLKISGETPQLLLLKVYLLRNQRDALDAEDKEDAAKLAKLDVKAPLKMLQDITKRWPDYAPAHHWLSHEYFQTAKDPDAGLAALRRYHQLEPLDPRTWKELGQELEKLQRWDDAAVAYREAIARDPNDSDRHLTLAVFYFQRNDLPAAQDALRAALKASSDADNVFWSFGYELDDEEKKLSFDEEKRMEQFLNLFPQELARSKSGLTRLAEAQSAQNRYPDVVKTMQRVLALGAEAGDYLTLARLSREAKRYTEALAAADQALKMAEDSAGAHYARAQALAQLGRHKEAVAALQKAIAQGEYFAYGLDEEDDFKPLAEMPEFKALQKKRE